MSSRLIHFNDRRLRSGGIDTEEVSRFNGFPLQNEARRY
jgi:hypothetical protein